MLVYRLEDRFQQGPYHNGHVDDVRDDDQTPTPRRDNITAPLWSEWRYAFASIEAYHAWFNVQERQRFVQYKYTLTVYELADQWVSVGYKQVAYHSNYAQFQYHIPLWEVSGMSENTP